MAVDYGGSLPVSGDAAMALAKMILGPYGQYDSDEAYKMRGLSPSALMAGLSEAARPYRETEAQNLAREEAGSRAMALILAHQLSGQSAVDKEFLTQTGRTRQTELNADKTAAMERARFDRTKEANRWHYDAPQKPRAQAQLVAADEPTVQAYKQQFMKEAKAKGQSLDQAAATEMARRKLLDEKNPQAGGANSLSQGSVPFGMQRGPDQNLGPGAGARPLPSASDYAGAYADQPVRLSQGTPGTGPTYPSTEPTGSRATTILQTPSGTPLVGINPPSEWFGGLLKPTDKLDTTLKGLQNKWAYPQGTQPGAGQTQSEWASLSPEGQLAWADYMEKKRQQGLADTAGISW